MRMVRTTLALAGFSLSIGWAWNIEVKPIANLSRIPAELKYQEVLTNIAMLQGRNLRVPLPTDGPGALPPPGNLPGMVGPDLGLHHNHLLGHFDPLHIPWHGGPGSPDHLLGTDKRILLDYAYQKAIGFRFDLPIEKKVESIFGGNARLFAALKSGWFCTSPQRKKYPPGAMYVGEYDGVAVWVYSYNVASLAEFTFALDYIVRAPSLPSFP